MLTPPGSGGQPPELSRRDVGLFALGSLTSAVVGCHGSAVPALDATTAADIVRLRGVRELRACTGRDGSFALLECYASPGDGGGGLFVWSPAAHADDGGTFFTQVSPPKSAPGWRRLYSGPLNVNWFGAAAGSTADSTACFALALSSPAGGSVYVPSGTYRIAGTIVVSQMRQLILEANAILRRHVADSSTEPVVRLTGWWPALQGRGLIQSDRPSPNGIVRIGPETLGQRDNIQCPSIDGIRIQGNSSPESIALACISSEKHAGHGAANYRGTLTSITIQDVAIGLELGDTVNGYFVSGVQFANIGRYSYQCTACGENTFVGGFTHYSAALAEVIHLESAAYTLFYGVQAEPGGRSARYFSIDAGSTWVQIHGHDNCPVPSIDLGTESTITLQPVFQVNTTATPPTSGPASNTWTGRGVIPPGSLECIVANSRVKSTSQLFVTPMGPEPASVGFVATPADGHFRVGLEHPLTAPWTFSWLVVP